MADITFPQPASRPISPVRELLVGAVAGAVTETVFYALDSAKILLQLQLQLGPSASHPPAAAALWGPRLFKGVVPSVLLGSVPSFGCFFMIYVPLKTRLQSRQGSHVFSATLAASTLAAVPSSLIAVPSDVVKKLMFSDQTLSYRGALRKALAQGGGGALFVGWRANIARDLPFIIAKMSLYEVASEQYRARRAPSAALSGLETGLIGFGAGALAALVTAPADCVNTRIKSGELASYSLFSAHVEVFRRDGIRGFFRGIGPRVLITGCGSTLFWFTYSKVQTYVT